MATMTRRKTSLGKQQSAVLTGGRVRAIHVFFPALEQLRAGNPDAAVWAVRSRDRDGAFSRMRLFTRVEIMGSSWSHTMVDGALPGTKGRGVAPLMTRASIRVFWVGAEPRTQQMTDD